MTAEYDSATVWLFFVAAGVGTYALRLSFILLLGRLEEVPPRVVGVLRFVPAAVFAALVVPAIVSLTVEPTIGFEADGAKVVAGVVAALTGWYTKNILATIGVGMGVLWLVQFGL